MNHKNIAIFFILTSLLVACAGIYNNDIKRAKEAGIPIIITRISPGYPNSAGGVDAYVNFINTSNKTFKYVLFAVRSYNRVGDYAPSEIGGESLMYLESTGPYYPRKGNFGLYWENIWYNSTISCIEIEEVKITYIDGSIEKFRESDIYPLLAYSVANSCKF